MYTIVIQIVNLTPSIMNTKTTVSKNTGNKKKDVTPLYRTTSLTKNSSRELWVTFAQGKPSNGLVFSSTLSRDLVRRKAAKLLHVPFEDVRSRRVRSYRKLLKK